MKKLATFSVLLSLCNAPMAFATSEAESIAQLLQDDASSPIRFDFNYAQSAACGRNREGYCYSSKDTSSMAKIIEGMVQDKVDGKVCSIEFLKQTRSLVEDAVKSYPATFAKANVTVKPFFGEWTDGNGYKMYSYSMKLVIQLPAGGSSVVELVKTSGNLVYGTEENRSNSADCKFTSMSNVKEQLKLAAEISQLTQDPNVVNPKADASRDAQSSARSDSTKVEAALESLHSLKALKKKAGGAN